MNTLKSFVDVALASGDQVFVRLARWQDRKALGGNQVRELRSKKNNHSAIAYDDLGNVSVLTRDGVTVQLISREEERKYNI
jgi:predicted lipoprotein